jgi:hypothetical protein
MSRCRSIALHGDATIALVAIPFHSTGEFIAETCYHANGAVTYCDLLVHCTHQFA